MIPVEKRHLKIGLLGEGSLYAVNRNKHRWEIRRQRRIFVLLLMAIAASIAVIIYNLI